MYPCANTSQSTAFRLATLKYLEEARQTALNATSQPVPKVNTASKGAHRARTISSTSTTSKPLRRTVSQSSTSDTTVRRTKVTIKPSLPQINSSKAKTSQTTTNVVASGSRTTSSASSVTPLNLPQSESQKAPKPTVNGWWWRDVVIRKAILEECTGEKFERLLLAFSIHALMGQSMYKSNESRLNQEFIIKYDSQVNFKNLLRLMLSSYVPGCLITLTRETNPRRTHFQLYQPLMHRYYLVLSTIPHSLTIGLLYWTRGYGKLWPFEKLSTIPILIREQKILQSPIWRPCWKPSLRI